MARRRWLVTLASALAVLLALLVGGATIRPAQASGWEADRQLTFGPEAARLTFNFARSIAADERGGVHIVWYAAAGARSAVRYQRSVDGGMSWGRPVPIAELGEHPAIAVSGATVYVVWHAAEDGRIPAVFLRRSADRGATWEPARRLVGHPTGSAHASVAASDRRVHVVWGDNRDGATEIYAIGSGDGGATWGPQTRISEVRHYSWVPTVAVEGERVYVGWVDLRDGNEEEYLRRSLDGGVSWGPIIRLTDDAADSWAPSLALAGEAVHVVWFDRRDSATTPEDIERRIDDALVLAGLPAEGVPPRDPDDPSYYYLPAFLERVRGKAERVGAAAPQFVQRGGDPRRLEAALRAFEEAMRAWGPEWEIYYKRSTDGGLTWGADVRLTSAPSSSARPSIAAAGADLHVVWFDGRDGNQEVYYKHSSDGGSTWEADVRLTNAGGDSLHPTVAASAGTVHVLWFDDRSGSPQLHYKRRR